MSTKQPRIRVAVVEDYLPLLQSLKGEIERSEKLRCVGQFEMCEDFLEAMPRIHADVVLIDLKLPKMDGFTCTREIKKRWPRVKVLVFSASDTDEDIVTVFGAGADGYVVKETNPHELQESIEAVFRSEWPMSWRVRKTMASYLQWRSRLLPLLSPREKEILELLERDHSRKEIAVKLGISFSTVRTHIERIFEKSNSVSAKGAVNALRRFQSA